MSKAVDHDVQRRELLRNALVLFAEKGYGSLSMKDLAAGLKISTGLLYHYFPGKEEIFLQMVRQHVRRMLGELSERISSGSGLDAKVHAIFEHIGEREADYQRLHLALNDFIRLIGVENFRSNPAIQESIERHFEDFGNGLHLSRDQAIILITYAIGVLVIGFVRPTRTSLGEHERILLSLLKRECESSTRTH